MPERSTIHSWLVSITCDRSWLVTTRDGTWVPKPRMRERSAVTAKTSMVRSRDIARMRGVLLHQCSQARTGM